MFNYILFNLRINFRILFLLLIFIIYSQKESFIVLFFQEHQLFQQLLIVISFQARIQEAGNFRQFNARHVRVKVLESVRKFVRVLNGGHDWKLFEVCKRDK